MSKRCIDNECLSSKFLDGMCEWWKTVESPGSFFLSDGNRFGPDLKIQVGR